MRITTWSPWKPWVGSAFTYSTWKVSFFFPLKSFWPPSLHCMILFSEALGSAFMQYFQEGFFFPIVKLLNSKSIYGSTELWCTIASDQLSPGGGVGECSGALGLVLDMRRGAEGDTSLSEKRVGMCCNCKGPVTSIRQCEEVLDCDGDLKYPLHSKHCHEQWELIAAWDALNVVKRNTLPSGRYYHPWRQFLASWVKEKNSN